MNFATGNVSSLKILVKSLNLTVFGHPRNRTTEPKKRGQTVSKLRMSTLSLFNNYLFQNCDTTIFCKLAPVFIIYRNMTFQWQHFSPSLVFIYFLIKSSLPDFQVQSVLLPNLNLHKVLLYTTQMNPPTHGSPELTKNSITANKLTKSWR